MVQHQIEDDPDAPLMRLRDEQIDIFKGPVLFLDGKIIRDIVSEISIGRAEDWTQPDGIDAQILQIAQTTDETEQITHSITITILKASHIDMIYYSSLPPRLIHASPPSHHATAKERIYNVFTRNTVHLAVTTKYKYWHPSMQADIFAPPLIVICQPIQRETEAFLTVWKQHLAGWPQCIY